MKILGGKFRGRNFYRPAAIRPTQNITRKAIFDIIGHDLKDKRVVDLFAGSGAIGLDALSRGAKEVVFVEKDVKCVKVINENLGLFEFDTTAGTGQMIEVVAIDAFAAIKHLARKKKAFDYVILDPPYGRGLAKKSLKVLEGYDIIQPNSVVIIEHQRREILPEHMGRFCSFKRRKYGTTVLTMYKINNED